VLAVVVREQEWEGMGITNGDGMGIGMKTRLNLGVGMGGNEPFGMGGNGIKKLFQLISNSECSIFLPNWFTFGGVISERVNTVTARSKVNPIFG